MLSCYIENIFIASYYLNYKIYKTFFFFCFLLNTKAQDNNFIQI